MNALADFGDDSPVISKRDKKEEKKRNREAARPAPLVEEGGEDTEVLKSDADFIQEQDGYVLLTEVPVSEEPATIEQPGLPKQRQSKWHKERTEKADKAEKQAKTEKRKDKPSGRIRFTTDSTQPDFVSMGLDKVSLMFGNEVVLKDATMSVSTGERVGLVGPNGGGKVSFLCVR